MDQHEDIWEHVFKRLAIKDVCRLRCVCKCWNSLISSAFFINLHFSFTSSSKPPHLKPRFHAGSRSCSLSNPTLDGTGVKDPQQEQLHFPGQVKVCSFSFVGVIHGVACISYCYRNPAFKSLRTTLLCNPRIRKYIILPYLAMREDHPYYSTGFGYDKTNNDFKVVLFWTKQGKYQVFSSRKGEWGPLATVEQFTSGWFHNGPTCFVNGSIYWALSRMEPIYENALLTFNCASLKFTRRLKTIPEALFCSPSGSVNLFSRINLLEFGGCMLAALVRNPISIDRLQLWVMNNNGGWDKVYTIFKHSYSNDDDSICVHNSTYEKMGPFGTKNPSKEYRKSRFVDVLTDRVYNESMFLMDHPRANSYTEKG